MPQTMDVRIDAKLTSKRRTPDGSLEVYGRLKRVRWGIRGGGGIGGDVSVGGDGSIDGDPMLHVSVGGGGGSDVNGSGFGGGGKRLAICDVGGGGGGGGEGISGDGGGGKRLAICDETEAADDGDGIGVDGGGGTATGSRWRRDRWWLDDDVTGPAEGAATDLYGGYGPIGWLMARHRFRQRFKRN